MAGGKLSPRQKMINMMYLVLTALLALNVSKEILKSFHLMEVSFNKAKENLDSKIDMQMTSLEKQSSEDPSLKPYYGRAQEAKKITDEFVLFIDNIKNHLEKESGGRQELDDPSPNSKPYDAELSGMDNMEVHANYFMVLEKGKNGQELERMVNETRANLVNILKQDTAKGIDIDPAKMKQVEDACQLSAVLTEDEAKKYPSWSAKYLEHTPLAGVMTMLTKMQNDAKATQSAVMDVLNQGQETIVKIESMTAIVKPINGSVIMSGGKYEAEIFLAAKTKGNENNEYELTKGGSKLEKDPVDGKWYYRADGTSAGTYDFAGVVKVKTPKGVEEYPFENAYQVFEGGATISATAMNVLYIGVDNPMSVGVPGVSPADVTVSMQGGSISRSGKGYVARVSNKGTATVVASAKMVDGTMRRVGSAEYRVKQLPKPEAKWGTVESGSAIPKQAAAIHRSIKADMGEGFVLDGITFRVTGCRFVLAPRKGEAIMQNGNGASIPPSFIARVKQARPGDRILVDKIRAVGPDGKQRNLTPIMIELR